MNILKELAILVMICLASVAVSALSPIPLPTSIVAMAVLFLLLMLRAIKTASVEKTADFLLSNMSVLFIPAGVGILKSAGLLKNNVVALLILCVISTILTFFVAYFATAAVAGMLARTQKEKK